MKSSKARIDLSEEQRAVVHAEHEALVVRAAAGAGKTAVLVERFLKHVMQDEIAPDAILTITFTKKAAAEMKKRIVAALTSAGLRHQAQTAETGPIQTIHSFCERVLRENSVEAGIDPDFEVIDEAEAMRLLEVAIQESFASAEPQEEELIELLAGKRERDANSAHAKLEDAIRKTMRDFRGSGFRPIEIKERHRAPISLLDSWNAAYVDSLDETVRNAFENENPESGFIERVRTAHKSLKRKLPKGIPSPDDFMEAEFANEICAKTACAIAALACRAWESYELALNEKKALDFTALEANAVQLIKHNAQIQSRLQRQYKVALIDEAQDLNPLQYALLQALGIEIEMRVGDAHQSIYGFRQADVELFLERAKATETLMLSTNYRSQEGILAFVDCCFARTWGDEYARMLPQREFGTPDPPFDGVELWRQKNKDTGIVADWIASLVREGEEPADIAILVRTSRYAQDLLPKLEALDVPARIAGGSERFYTRLEVRDLANALTAIENPGNDFALLATLRSPIVGLSLDSIVMLALTKPAGEAISSFVPAMEEDVEPFQRFLKWFMPLRSLGERLSAWEALSEIFARSDYFPNLARRPNGRQTLANVRKLLQLAAERPEMSPHSYAVLLRQIAEIRHREGDAPATNEDDGAVTIMTVHKAKGLEFPVVVLPDTHSALCRNRGEVEIDKKLGFVTTSFGTPRVSMFHEWIAERRKVREKAEELRLLYVGMTRAERRLCVVLDPQARSNSIAKYMADLLGFPEHVPPGATVREMRRRDEPSEQH